MLEHEDSPEIPREVEAEQPVQPEPVAEPEAVETSTEDTDSIEQEARELGWKSPDEWKGDLPDGYIDDPSEFIAKLERYGPFRKLREKLEHTQKSTEAELRKITAALEAGHKRDMQRQRDEYENRMRAIAAQQREAVEIADTEKYDALERQKRSMRPPSVDMPQPEENPLEPYVADKPWLNDPVLKKFAADAVDSAIRSGMVSGYDPKQQIEYGEQHVKRYFPQFFEAPKERNAPAPKVDGGGLAGVKKRSGFDSLPAEAKQAFQSQIARGIFEDNAEDRKFFYDTYTNG